MIFSFVCLFNGISSPYGLLNAEIWFTCNFFIVIMAVFAIFYRICKNNSPTLSRRKKYNTKNYLERKLE